jgi:hypothetical protein
VKSEPRQYKDVSGNPVTLDWLVRNEPEWAANQIRHRDKLETELHAANQAASDNADWFDALVRDVSATLKCEAKPTAILEMAKLHAECVFSQPRRIQLSRKKGWKLPPNTVVVSRPTRWGNPFVVGRDGSRATCVGLYEKLMAGYLCFSVKATPAAQNEARRHAAQHLGNLRGKNLACWCPANSACHADVLLRLANDQRPGAKNP